MAEYKITYTLKEKKWVRYVDGVTNENVAVMICDMDNPEIPREASLNVAMVCELKRNSHFVAIFLF